ncbi:MAG: hypothetical protein ACI308_00130 [Muribaculaceae bacterium]
MQWYLSVHAIRVVCRLFGLHRRGRWAYCYTPLQHGISFLLVTASGHAAVAGRIAIRPYGMASSSILENGRIAICPYKTPPPKTSRPKTTVPPQKTPPPKNIAIDGIFCCGRALL